MKKRIGLLGGSFNPVHIGHLRLALEVGEKMELAEVHLVPAYIPPHKGRNVLPFEWRAEMLEQSIQGVDGLKINLMEKERSEPSYTYVTLKSFLRRDPEIELFFILGSLDLLTVPQWFKGKELPYLAHFVVADRHGQPEDEIDEFVTSFWPAHKITFGEWSIEGGKRIYFFSFPRLDISSSLVRRKWLDGEKISFLVPGPVEKFLDEHRKDVVMYWKG
jgi:nicotinate-nucleotide adenylyltransferase